MPVRLRSSRPYADVAQLVERLLAMQKVRRFEPGYPLKETYSKIFKD